MSLGYLAKDSVLDLKALHEAEEARLAAGVEAGDKNENSTSIGPSQSDPIATTAALLQSYTGQADDDSFNFYDEEDENDEMAISALQDDLAMLTEPQNGVPNEVEEDDEENEDEDDANEERSGISGISDDVKTVDTAASPPRRVLEYEMPSDSYAKKDVQGKKGPLYDVFADKRKKKDVLQSLVSNLPWNRDASPNNQDAEEEPGSETELWRDIIVPEAAHVDSGDSPPKTIQISGSVSHPHDARRTSAHHHHHHHKGILKGAAHIHARHRADSDSSSISSGSTSSSGSSSISSSSARRRMFPEVDWYNKVPLSSVKQRGKGVVFAPKVRVVPPPQTREEWDKSDVWWQKCDYDEFRKVGELISKAIEEEGNGECKESKEDDESDPDKWFEAFGHSSRGLEHIASVEEGETRRLVVKRSIEAVLREQVRQKSEGKKQAEEPQQKDVGKIRTVYMLETHKARDDAKNKGYDDALQAATDEGVDTWEYQQWKRYRRQRRLQRREKQAARQPAAAEVEESPDRLQSIRRALRKSVGSVRLERALIRSRKLHAAAVFVQAAYHRSCAQKQRAARAEAVLKIQVCARQFLTKRGALVDPRQSTSSAASHGSLSTEKTPLRTASWVDLSSSSGSSFCSVAARHPSPLQAGQEVEEREIPEDLYLVPAEFGDEDNKVLPLSSCSVCAKPSPGKRAKRAILILAVLASIVVLAVIYAAPNEQRADGSSTRVSDTEHGNARRKAEVCLLETKGGFLDLKAQCPEATTSEASSKRKNNPKGTEVLPKQGSLAMSKALSLLPDPLVRKAVDEVVNVKEDKHQPYHTMRWRRLHRRFMTGWTFGEE